jgi:hypothetical protein
LYLGLNYFTGPLPALPNDLENIYLSGNSFSGNLQPSLQFLTKLEVLVLSDNNFSGQIPSWFNEFTKLSELFFSFNSFSGPLPDSIGQLTNLTGIYFNDNLFTGTVPESWSQLQNLVSLRLSRNRLSGELPLSLTHLGNLQTLDLRGNAFSGPIPDEFGSLANISAIMLSSNKLSGTVPDSLTALTKLSYLILGHNQIANISANTLTDLPSLVWLDLSNNSLALLPASLPSQLLVADFSSNQNLVGEIPAGWSEASARRIHLGNSGLYRDSGLFVYLPFVRYLDLSESTFLNEPLPSDFITLQSSGSFLNTTWTDFPCPYPKSSNQLVWIREACSTDLYLLWYLLGITGFLVLIAVVVVRYSRNKHKISGRPNRLSLYLRYLSAIAIWLAYAADVVMDLSFNVSMFQFIVSSKLSPSQCESLDFLFQPALYSEFPVSNYENTSISKYLDDLDTVLTLDAGYFRITLAEKSSIFNSVLETFQTQCSLMPGCQFSTELYGCRSQEEQYIYPVFVSFVLFFGALVVAKESVKAVCVLWCLYWNKASSKQLLLCSTSLMLPILIVVRPQIFKEIADHEPSPDEVVSEFVYEALFENIPQFCLGIYYSLTISGLGIAPWQILSVYLSGLSMFRHVAECGFAFADKYCGFKVSKYVEGNAQSSPETQLSFITSPLPQSAIDDVIPSASLPTAV